MGTLTIPQTFGADTTLRADKLDENFAAIRNYFNGVSGGIDGTNINSTARLALSQVAEPLSVSHLTWCCYVGGATGQSFWTNLPFPTEVSVRSMRVGVVKNGTGLASFNAYLFTPGGEAARIYFDDSTEGGTVARKELDVGVGGPPGTNSFLQVRIDSTTSDVELVSVQLEIVRQHVKV